MRTGSPSQILENLTTAVLTFDSHLCLSSINPAGEMLFEISAKKAVGQSLTDLLPHARLAARTLMQTLESQHPFTARSVPLKLPGARTITVDCTVTPLADTGSEGALLVELTQVDRLLRLARDENLLDRQATNRAVMRGLAHEIKNPLGGLRGAAQLLERELPDKSLREYTRIIIHEADRLRNLVDRMIGPHQPLKKIPVNVHEILEHVRKLMLVEVPVGLTVIQEYDPSLPEFECDPEQLTQAVLNMVRNAVEAMHNAGTIRLRTRIERQFTIGHKRHRLVLRVDIEDSGPGIPEDLQEHIFYPMITGKPEGTGLGLSIAQDIAAKHGGLIECRSRPGETVFSLYLPLENSHGQT
ncbi:MAG: PAS domain-containing sensor histidine kinase [Candidatus Muproteobacteria bacterium RBG_16_62_13]|uniref:Sensory histidine kinase/phosphatase NtrB n=1 Tax=Candidatus Muproteobacteria bacterium RBG_16_62_13 TaxID=1817756 RepID=A0A1F6T356_9PROT|nr:MAG: PAS domain-containing sensor histidine kinase [Candidatus Muproteobacteria bacterium RBG_16_62_13]